jgi:hypothetical protein
MQTKTLFYLPALFMCCGAFAQHTYQAGNSSIVAEKETSFQVSVLADKTMPAVGLHINNPQRKKINIKISQNENGVMVDTVIASDQYNCRYNFSETEDGRYLIELSSGKEKLVKTINIKSAVMRNVLVE